MVVRSSAWKPRAGDEIKGPRLWNKDRYEKVGAMMPRLYEKEIAIFPRIPSDRLIRLARQIEAHESPPNRSLKAKLQKM